MRPVIASRRTFGSLLAAAAVLIATAAFAADVQYKTHGVVKSFGPNRAYVNVAHEKIPGYMEAMTMSFEPRLPHQLDGIEVGRTVSLTFTATRDGHRLIDGIVQE